MNLLAIVGSPRKGKSTDTLVDKAIEGAKTKASGASVKKIYLADHRISYCKNCLACRDNKNASPFADCVIRDDMDELRMDVFNSDRLLFGFPLHMGYVSAMLMTFLERICWTFAKPGGKYFTVRGCPVPRSDKKRKAAAIITNSVVPPLYRMFCDNAAPLIKCIVRDSLNGKMVGDLYAGDLEHRGAEYYFEKARKLGEKLAQ